MFSKVWTLSTRSRTPRRVEVTSPSSESSVSSHDDSPADIDNATACRFRDVVIADAGELPVEKEVDAEGNEVPLRIEL